MTTIRDALAAAFARAGATATLVRDPDAAVELYRIARQHGGSVALWPDGDGWWHWHVYETDDDEPVARGDARVLSTVADLLTPWVIGTGRDIVAAALAKTMLPGEQSVRPIADVADDWIARFGVGDHALPLHIAYALLHVGAGDDLELVELPQLDGAPLVRSCPCGAYLDPDVLDEKRRLSCETCGCYFTEHGVRLPHPEELTG